MGMRRFRSALLAALTAACVLASGAGSSMALFSGAVSAGSNTITVGTWSTYVAYLHNRPSPPVGNTVAQYDLAANATKPTAGTLYRYDTDGANRAGRGIVQTATPSAGLTTPYQYVNWYSPAFASDMTIGSRITVDIWSALDITASNKKGSLIVYVRDWDIGAGTVRNVGSGTLTLTYAHSRTFYETPIAVAAAGYVVRAGHVLELKIESPAATSGGDMLVAYDTALYPATLSF
jgi:hypothetical protein